MLITYGRWQTCGTLADPPLSSGAGMLIDGMTDRTNKEELRGIVRVGPPRRGAHPSAGGNHGLLLLLSSSFLHNSDMIPNNWVKKIIIQSIIQMSRDSIITASSII